MLENVLCIKVVVKVFIIELLLFLFCYICFTYLTFTSESNPAFLLVQQCMMCQRRACELSGLNSGTPPSPPLLMNDFTISSDISAVELCSATCSNPSDTE